MATVEVKPGPKLVASGLTEKQFHEIKAGAPAPGPDADGYGTWAASVSFALTCGQRHTTSL